MTQHSNPYTLNSQPLTLKVCASEQELSLLKLLQRVQPKLNNEVVNPQPYTPSRVLSAVAMNSGAYMHWMVLTPQE